MNPATALRTSANSAAHIGNMAAITARKHGELAIASGQVIAARLALASSPGVATPGGQAEMARMMPEKAEAFAASGLGAARHIGAMAANASAEILRETTHVASAVAAMAMSTNPMALMAAQQRYVMGWFGRAIESTMELTAATARMHEAMLAPVHKTATANARRLQK